LPRDIRLNLGEVRTDKAYADHWLQRAGSDAKLKSIGLVLLITFAIIFAFVGAAYVSEWNEWYEWKKYTVNMTKAEQISERIARELENLRDRRGEIRQFLRP
jgi:hypothetical protein